MKKILLRNDTDKELRLLIEPVADLYIIEAKASVILSSKFIEGQDWIDVGVHEGLEGLAVQIWATEELTLRDHSGLELTFGKN
jgi:hypothetical protein